MFKLSNCCGTFFKFILIFLLDKFRERLDYKFHKQYLIIYIRSNHK